MERLGRYELVRVLGRGGMGVVHEAVLHGPGGFRKPVALKVLHDTADLLRQEARIGGLLRHRNLVDVYEVGEQDGVWFCAMELCAGGSLSGHIPLPPRAVVEVGLAVCAALQYAHEDLRLVHLDLKPENLLIGDGAVKVADLGIARAEGFEDDGRVRGTPAYMPPEQGRGEPVDARADIYALGITLVELAAGARPHASGTVSWTSLDGDFDQVQASTGVPEWLAPVVDRCLEAAPADRWPNMAALAAALRALPVEGPGLREAIGGAEPEPVRVDPLGAEPDAFVGRQPELEALAGALSEPCLVVLKGPAGIGKSRLAATAARRWRGPGRAAWVCDLAAVRSVDGMLAAVASTLDVPLASGPSAALARQLGHALAGRGEALVVLDGFEHLEAGASVLAQWRQLAPRARFVLTSRSVLRVDAELVLPVDPLDPADGTALLVARARQRGAEVEADDDLTALAERLDGVPLALELAAGRLGVLSVRDVHERLGLSLLRRGTDDRHGTLRAALDWSWELLTPPERAALAQLSVFAGGFTLQAAEDVVALHGASVLETVGALVDHSLVADRGEGRFSLLAGTSEYASEWLVDREATEARHGRHYARLGTDAALDALDVATDGRAFVAYVIELDNLVSACRRAVARGDREVAVYTLRAGWTVMKRHGPASDGAALAGAVASMAGLTPIQRLDVLQVHAAVSTASGAAGVGEANCREEVALAQQIGDRARESSAINNLACLHHDQGRLQEARELYEAALAIAREVGASRLAAMQLGNLGNVHCQQERLEEALACYEEALRIHRAGGYLRSESLVLGNMAALLRRMGRFEEARAAYRDALAYARRLGDRRGEGVILGNLGHLERQLGRLDEACARVEEALAVHRAIGNRRSEGAGRINLGCALLDLGRLDEARAHFDAALALHRELGNRAFECSTLSCIGMLELAQGRPAEARDRFLGTVALAREIGLLRWEGHALLRLAQLDAAAGEAARAAEHLAEGRAIILRTGDPSLVVDVHAARAEVLWYAGDQASALEALAEAEAARGPPDAMREIERVRALVSAPPPCASGAGISP